MRNFILIGLFASAAALPAQQTGMIPSPDRRPGEGVGPFKTLAIRGVTVIDGTGAPARSADVGIRNGLIARIGSIPASEGRERLDRSGLVLAPGFIDVHTHADDVAALATEVGLPCVVKAVSLSASRGVLRADTPDEAARAAGQIRHVLRNADVGAEAPPDPEGPLIVESYTPGSEVAVEGLLVGGHLEVLAIFDKPEPMEGPTFEETMLVTPSRLPPAIQEAVRAEFGCPGQTLDRVQQAAEKITGAIEQPESAGEPRVRLEEPEFDVRAYLLSNLVDVGTLAGVALIGAAACDQDPTEPEIADVGLAEADAFVPSFGGATANVAVVAARHGAQGEWGHTGKERALRVNVGKPATAVQREARVRAEVIRNLGAVEIHLPGLTVALHLLRRQIRARQRRGQANRQRSGEPGPAPRQPRVVGQPCASAQLDHHAEGGDVAKGVGEQEEEQDEHHDAARDQRHPGGHDQHGRVIGHSAN